MFLIPYDQGVPVVAKASEPELRARGFIELNNENENLNWQRSNMVGKCSFITINLLTKLCNLT